MSAPVAVTLVAHDVGSVGGMERQLAELALGLRARGHHVTVIARTCVLPADAGVAFHRVRGPRRPFPLAYPWFMLAGSLTVWRRRRGLVQATGAIVCNRVDAIAVHCCHQVYRAQPNRSGRLARLYVSLVGRLMRAAERLCYRANRRAVFICVSEGVAAEMRKHFPAAAARVVTIHNGVDTTTFAPTVRAGSARALRARLGVARGRSVAAFVGDGNKGLRAVLEALVRAPEWDLLVAGRGHVRHYQELARALGVAPAVHWLGVVRDIPVVYELADAFVLPSSYETFSLVTFEAAASGLPLLATDVGGVRELLRDTENGFVISAHPEEIAERLRQLAADAALRTRLGLAAREAALAFTWQNMLAAHERLYRELCQPRTAL